MRNALLVLASLLCATTASAAGFQVSTHDARATAMADAVTADVDDASAVFYNPAGIASGQKLSLRLGDTLIVPMFSFTADGTTTTADSKPVPPPHAYLAYGLTEDASLGVGFFMPYGLDITWPQGWPGRFSAGYSALRNYFINPEVAYRFLGRIRVGAGVQVVRSTVELRRQLNLVGTEAAGNEATLDLGAGAWGVGGNAGIQADLLTKESGLGVLSVGLAYRSPVTLDFNNGTAHFSNVLPDFASQLKDQAVSTSATLPSTLSLGVAWHYSSLRLGFDAQYVGWQTVHALDLTFADSSLNQSLLKQLHYVWNFALGGELGLLSDRLFLRLGVQWDPSPFPDSTLSPDLPDANRLNVSGGLGYRQSGFGVDLGYMCVILLSHTSTYAFLPGSYSGNAQVIGLTVGYTM